MSEGLVSFDAVTWHGIAGELGLSVAPEIERIRFRDIVWSHQKDARCQLF